MTLHDFGFLGQGHHHHGTRANYRTGCRCTPCRSANAAYEQQRAGARARGDGFEWVSPDQAKAKLEMLARIGIGHRHAAKLAGVSVSTVQRIRTGTARRLRSDVAAAIVGLEQLSLAKGVYVNGYETRHYVESLMREGFTKRWLALKLGLSGGRVRMRHEQVTVLNALRVRQLHHELTAE